MKRYAETFFRYWLIALIPIIVIPMVEYALIRHTPTGLLASANIWVDQSPAGASPAYSQWEPPAQIEVDTLNQLLQTASFDVAVAQNSPAYNALLKGGSASAAAAVDDISKNVKVSAVGPSLVNVTYSSTAKYWALAQQVVQSVLSEARNQAQLLNQQQSKEDISYYSYQLQAARQRESQSARQLSDYMTRNGITALDLATLQTSDSTLAALYQQNQRDLADVNTAQQALTKAQEQAQLPASLAGASNFHVIDPPTLSVVSSKKKEVMNLAIALVLGLLLSGGFLVAKTALDRTVRYPEEIEPLIKLPVLAVVPFSATLAAQTSGNLQPSKPAAQRGLLLGTGK